MAVEGRTSTSGREYRFHVYLPRNRGRLAKADPDRIAELREEIKRGEYQPFAHLRGLARR